MGLNKSDDSADQKEELEMVQEREQIRKAKMTNQVKPKGRFFMSLAKICINHKTLNCTVVRLYKVYGSVQ